MSRFFGFICRKCSPVFIFLLFFQSAFSQYNFTVLNKKLESHSKELGDNIVALLYKDNKVIFEKKIGEFDKRTTIPIASCSKWLTTAMIMTLVDEGKISLDDKVSNYIPLFATYRKSYITIRHCLSHQTGIKQEQPSIMNILERKKYASLEEEVNSFAKKEIDFNPGTGFYYGDIGLNIAARICEIVTKKNFNQLMLEKIFRPMGMRVTTFQNENYNLPPNPSGGAKSCPEDYLNFLIMILHKGIYKDKRILSESAIKEMEKQQIDLATIRYTPKATDGYSYGLGEWLISKDADNQGEVISCPGLFGSVPLIDNCRGYAFVLFTKTLQSGENRKTIYADIIDSIDQIILSEKCN